MTHNSMHGATSGVLSWSAHTPNLTSIADEEAGDVDEPPDSKLPYSPIKETFKRNPIRRSVDYHTHSLLTKALHTSEDDADAHAHFFALKRSTLSNASIASTADLTSDTGLTSPSRTNTPSPPLPELRFTNIHGEQVGGEKQAPAPPAQEVKKEPRKRCIQFACAAKPAEKPIQKPAEEHAPTSAAATAPKPAPPRKTCIKFACPAPRSTSAQSTPPAKQIEHASSRLHPSRENSPVTARKVRPGSHSRSPRPVRSRHSSRGDTPRKAMPQKKYITCSDKDLHHDAARFHEFASDDHSDEDWMKEKLPTQTRKLTINDTLARENEIRRLAAEAEEEAEQEEEELELDQDEDEAENTPGIDDDDDDDDDLDDGLSGYATEDEDEDDSVGYHTDEETGFAASDDENDDLQLWTPAQPAIRLSGGTPVARRPSLSAQHSDSSIGSFSSVRAVRSGKVRRMKIRPGTPELPDSTDFVCGTLDEDRPIEEAYISCMAARRREKLHLIPQDIDPSFPASDPENEDEEEIYNPVKHASDDDDVWLHGEMDDLDQDDRRSRKKKGEHHSPKRYHSPPPKRHISPPTARGRGRSPPPKGLFDRRSPRRIRSPPPQMIRSPPASLRAGPQALAIKELGSRPGLTVTKSLPRPAAMFPNMRNGRRGGKPAQANDDNDVHVRSAIDIVKGLEKKRQRRKEKYYQKYCNRARKGQVLERKPMPGTGCERMRELGLLMAGKIEQGNYVLSI